MSASLHTQLSYKSCLHCIPYTSF